MQFEGQWAIKKLSQGVGCALVALLSLAQAAWSAPAHLKIMCVGASITMGLRVNGGYRLPLEQKLTAAGVDFEFVGSQSENSKGMVYPEHEGYPGHRIDQIEYGGTNSFHVVSGPIVDTLSEYKPNVVLLLCGTNDIMQHRDLQDAPSRLDHLVGTILGNDPGVTVYVASLPPLSLHESEDEAYNAGVQADVAQRAANGDKVVFVDMFTPLNADTDIGPDHIHPNAGGYAKLAQIWFNAMGYH